MPEREKDNESEGIYHDMLSKEMKDKIKEKISSDNKDFMKVLKSLLNKDESNVDLPIKKDKQTD